LNNEGLCYRMIKQNKYISAEIEAKTGFFEPDSIVCVGNYIQRNQLEYNIKNSIPTVLVGDHCVGRMTSVLYLVNKLNLNIYRNHSGEDFGEEPIYDDNTIFVVRFSKMNKWFKLYSKSKCRIILISDKKVSGYDTISYSHPTAKDIEEYERIKGEKFPIYSVNVPSTEKQIVMRALRQGISLEEMPDNLAKWFAVNFSNSKKVLKLCSFADSLKDNFFKHKILSLVRYKKPISLKIPYGVKRGSN